MNEGATIKLSKPLLNDEQYAGEVSMCVFVYIRLVHSLIVAFCRWHMKYDSNPTDFCFRGGMIPMRHFVFSRTIEKLGGDLKWTEECVLFTIEWK